MSTSIKLKRARNGDGHRSVHHYEGRYRQPRTTLDRGINRRILTDGFGRRAAWWIATLMCQGVYRYQKYSVTRWTEAGARQMAMARRAEWLVEHGLVKQADLAA